MTKKAVLNGQSYPQLFSAIKSAIAEGQENIRKQMAKTYWNVGKLISQHMLQNKDRAGYGEKLFPRLSRDLKIHKTTLHLSIKFYEQNPIVHARTQLTWAHYRSLIPVSDKRRRKRLEGKAVHEKLSSRQLEAEIRKSQSGGRGQGLGFGKQNIPNTQTLTPKPLQSSPGRLYTYHVFQNNNGSVLVDCGFDIWREIPKSTKGITLVDSRKDMSFTYRAEVERVIDGDTIWLRVNLGLNTFTRQKIRLRGIDTPEIDTQRGKEAKRYVEKALKDVETITIKTSTSDKYDRYLADVFYGEDNTYLNQQLLDERLATRYEG